MRFPDKWWTYPAESENGRTIIVTGRDGLDKVMDSGKYRYRLDVSWDYEAGSDGMPSDEESRLMEQATDALRTAFDKSRSAVLTGIYTGDGRRDLIFYSLNLKVFSYVFNEALAGLPPLPLHVEATEDVDWSEYRDMRASTYVPDED